jgi:hypothetical protein
MPKFKANILYKRDNFPKANRGGVHMGKRKKDASTIGLNSAQVEGQGTTTTETGARAEPSSRKKQKRY